jgi:hypothetical protein
MTDRKCFDLISFSPALLNKCDALQSCNFEIHYGTSGHTETVVQVDEEIYSTRIVDGPPCDSRGFFDGIPVVVIFCDFELRRQTSVFASHRATEIDACVRRRGGLT